MKEAYLQHEYGWSSHCITGNALGWGITASSVPNSVAMLKELEKLAADIEPDQAWGQAVEEMIYSPSLGYVRLWALPAPAGEDGRKHKLVRLLQTEDPQECRPEVYFARPEGTGSLFSSPGPGPGSWDAEGETSGKELPRIYLKPWGESPAAILRSLQCIDKLPAFLHAIFWSLLEYRGSLGFVAADWSRKDFPVNASRLMFAIHSLLPPYLRKKAGYRSYAEKEPGTCSFYFSGEARGRACFDLSMDVPDLSDGKIDDLSVFFFEKMAFYFKEEPQVYEEVLSILSDYLSENEGKGNSLEKIQWILYDFAASQDQSGTGSGADELLPFPVLASHLPDLMYWSEGDPTMDGVTERILDRIHNRRLDPQEEDQYVEALLGKVSGRTLPRIAREVTDILRHKKTRKPENTEKEIAKLRLSGESVYKEVRKILEKEEEWSAYFIESDKLDQTPLAPADEKEAGSKGEDDLKEEVLKAERSPKDEKSSLEERNLQEGRSPVKESNPRGDKDPVKKKKSGEARSSKKDRESGETRNPKKARKSEKGKRSDAEEAENKTDERGSGGRLAQYTVLDRGRKPFDRPFLEFLMTGLPVGFLTGCVMFLSHYSLMIGHWKIAIGMGGMWLILILNTILLQRNRASFYPMWMKVGFYLLLGELMEIAASYFIPQKYRLLFFAVLGFLIVLLQLIYLARGNDTI